jgi:DNA-directed RNA polymerase specialized sigma24 family protein
VGVAGIDKNAKERKLEALFPMHTKEGVEAFLENYNHLYESMYFSGDYDALIMIVDFQVALLECGLTEKERTVIHLVFVQDMKRVDVAKFFNVRKQTVQNWLNRAIEKIANYYAKVEGVSE